jgi:hypothetical protein
MLLSLSVSVGVEVGVNRLKGVSEGRGVEVGRGAGVCVGSFVGPGVHVDGRTPRGVGVIVGISALAGSVGGGKGLKAEYGLKKSEKNAIVTQAATSRMITVSVFQTRADTFRVGWV